MFGKAEEPEASRELKTWLGSSIDKDRVIDGGVRKIWELEESEEGEATIRSDQEWVSGVYGDSFRRGRYILKRHKMEREGDKGKLDFFFTEFRENSDLTNVEGVGEQVQSKFGTPNWYCGIEDPEASEGLKEKGWTFREQEAGKKKHKIT